MEESGISFASAGGSSSFYIKTNGALWAMGNGAFGKLGIRGSFNALRMPPTEIVSEGVVSVSSLYFHSLFIKNDGSLWGMGALYGAYNGIIDDAYTPEIIIE